MSEITQPAPDKQELPKWDRSAEGVHNAVGRIANKLYTRAARVAGDETRPLNYREIPANDMKDSLRLLTIDYPHILASRESGIATEARTLSTRGDDSKDIKLEVERRMEDRHPVRLSIRTNPESVHAHLDDFNDKGNWNENVRKLDVVSPTAVADVTANALNQIRGQIAQAELDTKQQMIDFVNNSENTRK